MAVSTPGNEPSKSGTALGDALARAQVQQSSGAAAQAAPQEQVQQQGGTSNGSRGYSRSKTINPLMNFNNVSAAPISRYSAGAVVRGFESSLKKIFEESIDPAAVENFQFHILDNQNQGLALSSLLYTFVMSEGGKNYVAVFNMVVEGSGPNLSNRVINMGDRSVEIATVAGDVLDPLMWDKVVSFLTERYGRDIIVLNAGSMVLPKTLSPDLAVSTDNLRQILYYSTQALSETMNINVTNTRAPISLTMLDSSVTLNAEVNYNVPVVHNAVGQPVRSDISIVLRASQQQGNSLSTQHEFSRDLTRVDGYIDLQWHEPQQQVGMMVQQDTRRYVPRYVLTNIDALTDTISLEHMLLGLSTSTLLSSNFAWAGVYLNRYGVGGRDLRDIGAIGYEINLSSDPNATPDRIDTRSDTFSRNNMIQLLTMAFFPQVIYSLDVEETGELAWLHQTFIAAANGDAAAYKLIVDAANNLTGGAFSTVWGGGQIAQDDYNRIHLGHYTAPSGEVRDIRDLDYLGLLNLIGDRDMQSVVDWSMSYDDTATPWEIRLERRAKILQAALPNCVITGYARRISFRAEFIDALLSACAKAGLSVRQQNVAFLEGTASRGQFNIQGFAVGGQGPSNGVFTYGGQNNFGNRGNQAFFGNFSNFYQPR